MSAHVPKSVYDNTKTERTKNSSKSKFSNIHTSHVAVRNHYSVTLLLTNHKAESSVVVIVVLHSFRTILCSSTDFDLLKLNQIILIQLFFARKTCRSSDCTLVHFPSYTVIYQLSFNRCHTRLQTCRMHFQCK